MIVLVPAYEPDGRLLSLVGDLLAASPDISVVVVDDGSGSDHRALFAAVGRLGAEVLTHPVNRGKGAALRTGFGWIAARRPGEDVVCADSDGQHMVLDVLRVAARVRETPGIVLGVRGFTGPVPARSRLGNRASRALFRLATGQSVTDTQTGLRGYPAGLLPWLLRVPGNRFEYEFEVLLRAARQRRPIAQLPIATVYLAGNASSHFRPVADSVRVYAPLLAFLASSLGAFLLDTVALLALHALTGSLLLSVVGARALSSSANFLVNRRVVFAAGRPGTLVTSARRYGVLAALLLTANTGLLAALSWCGLPLLAAKLLTEPLLVGASFAAQSRAVFPGGARERAVSALPSQPTLAGISGVPRI